MSSEIYGWFDYINADLITEGLQDLRLPSEVEEEIIAAMPNASEKARMWIGQAVKSEKMTRPQVARSWGRYTLNSPNYMETSLSTMDSTYLTSILIKPSPPHSAR